MPDGRISSIAPILLEELLEGIRLDRPAVLGERVRLNVSFDKGLGRPRTVDDDPDARGHATPAQPLFFAVSRPFVNTNW